MTDLTAILVSLGTGLVSGGLIEFVKSVLNGRNKPAYLKRKPSWSDYSLHLKKVYQSHHDGFVRMTKWLNSSVKLFAPPEPENYKICPRQHLPSATLLKKCL